MDLRGRGPRGFQHDARAAARRPHQKITPSPRGEVAGGTTAGEGSYCLLLLASPYSRLATSLLAVLFCFLLSVGAGRAYVAVFAMYADRRTSARLQTYTHQERKPSPLGRDI